MKDANNAFSPDTILQERYKIVELLHTGPGSRMYKGLISNGINIFLLKK